MRHGAKLSARGISALEVLLAVLFLISLSAVVIPTGRRSFSSDLVEVARSDCHRIAQGLVGFAADSGKAPTGYRGAASFGWLKGPGESCGFKLFPKGEPGEIGHFLLEDRMGFGEDWGGPYVDGLDTDPWGRNYVVLLQGLGREEGINCRVWVLSAGPDGRIETLPEDLMPAGDDIGQPLDL